MATKPKSVKRTKAQISMLRAKALYLEQLANRKLAQKARAAAFMKKVDMEA